MKNKIINSHNSKGISLIALIITIIVIVILAITIYASNIKTLQSMSEAKYKSELRGLQDRLKIYNEDAELEMFKYKKSRLTWNGEDERATNTGKVEDAQKGIDDDDREEDTGEFIFGEIPSYFKGKIAIEEGNLVVKKEKVTEDEKEWTEELQIVCK